MIKSKNLWLRPQNSTSRFGQRSFFFLSLLVEVKAAGKKTNSYKNAAVRHPVIHGLGFKKAKFERGVFSDGRLIKSCSCFSATTAFIVRDKKPTPAVKKRSR